MNTLKALTSHATTNFLNRKCMNMHSLWIVFLVTPVPVSQYLSSPDTATAVEFPPHTPQYEVKSGKFLGNTLVALSMKHETFLYSCVWVSQCTVMCHNYWHSRDWHFVQPPFTTSTACSIIYGYFGECREMFLGSSLWNLPMLLFMHLFLWLTVFFFFICTQNHLLFSSLNMFSVGVRSCLGWKCEKLHGTFFLWFRVYDSDHGPAESSNHDPVAEADRFFI